MSDKISTSEVAKRISESFKYGAISRAEKKIDEMENRLRQLGCEVVSAPCDSKDKFDYKKYGYYRFSAQDEYRLFKSAKAGMITERKEYGTYVSFIKNDDKGNYNASIMDDHESYPFTFTYEKVKAERWVKPIKEGTTEAVKLDESKFNDKTDTDHELYFDVKDGASLEPPKSKLPFWLKGLCLVVASVFMLLFYLLSTARFGKIYLWDGMLFNLIPGFFEFASKNQLLTYVSMGVAAGFTLISFLLSAFYTGKYEGRKSGTETACIIQVIVMLALFGLGYLTFDLTNGVLPRLVGVVSAQVLGTILFIIENIVRIGVILFLLYTVIVGCINLCKNNEYKSVVKLCERRKEFMSDGGAKFAEYERALDDIAYNSYTISALDVNKEITYIYFDNHYDEFQLVGKLNK